MKKIIKKKVDYDLNWIFDVTLEQLKKDINKLEELGVSYIEFTPYENYGHPSLDVEAYIEREETDKEYKDRFINIIKQGEIRKQEELNLLKELKQKYENK